MSSLIYGPVAISDPLLGCPIVVAAGKVKSAREGKTTQRFATGWGTSFEEAARNCLYEADETYGAQSINGERVLRARADDLPGRVIEPPALLCYSDEQFRKRRTRTSETDERHRIPARWQRSRPIDWIRSDPRFGKGAAWVPARLCVLGYERDAQGMPLGDSNGLATGETLEDAAVRGFCELVERDATAIWWYNRLIAPRVDPAWLGGGLVADFRAWLETQGRSLHLLSLTLDFRLPVVAAISHNSDGRELAFGFGAGHSLARASRQAVGELAQCEANLDLLKRHAGSAGTSGFTASALQLYNWHRETDVGKHPHLVGRGTLVDPPADIALDWEACRRLCHERQLEPAVVDLTHISGGPLIRAIVPGMRSTKPRFGRGRLYDVPRQLGLRAEREPIDITPFPI